MRAVGDNDYFVGVGVGIFIAVTRFKIGDGDIDEADSLRLKPAGARFSAQVCLMSCRMPTVV